MPPDANRRPAFRFAPSPNGRLHLGHAYSALLTHGLAAAAGGRFLLRIEDIDTARCTPAFEAAIRDDLAWLGLVWDEPVLRQSTRFPAYAAAAAGLRARRLLYPCFATRGDILAAYGKGDAPRDPDGAPLYPGLWRGAAAAAVAARLAAGDTPAWRLDMALALAGAEPLGWTEFDARGRETEHRATPALWGDAVLVRRDTPASYHLAVVVDDAAQGITHVTRGADLAAATHLHRLVQALLGLPTPRYHHHALILDAAGRKLSKSAGAQPLRALAATPDALLGMLRQRVPLP